MNESEKSPYHTQPNHASTYSHGEDPNRLASAAQYFGLRNSRTPLRPIREAIPESSSHPIDNSANDNSNTTSEKNSQSILKFGSTVVKNVGLIFSDSTLEAARMHSVGVTAAGEFVASDGTLHLRSIVRRLKKKKKDVGLPLGDMFKPLVSEEEEVETKAPLEMEEEEEYEEVIVETVEGGSISAAIFGIIKGMVGPAILYLPRGFSLSGYAVAIPAMICATVSYLYCATRLLQCWKVESDKMMQRIEQIRLLLDPEVANTKAQKKSGGHYGSTMMTPEQSPSQAQIQHQGKLLTYPELARRAFGNFAFLISGGIAGMQFGVCLTYLIFVPQNIYELIRNIFGINLPKQLILIGMLMIEIPLCWIRDIRKLTPFNILATFLIAFGLSSVLFIALFKTHGDSGANEGEMGLVEEVTHLPSIKDTWALFIGTSVSVSK
jgi:hypothetical protein